MRGCSERSEEQPVVGESAQQVARVVIAAGGTAGHVVPAIAVADALRAEGAEVTFLGTRDRAKAELVPAAGYEIDFLRVSGLDRRNPLRAALAAVRSARAVRAARRLLAERAQRVCLAFPIPGREGPPYLFTGRPVPRAVLEADRGAARERFGLAVNERCLAVVGGSL